jgi:hypothetical protein
MPFYQSDETSHGIYNADFTGEGTEAEEDIEGLERSHKGARFMDVVKTDAGYVSGTVLGELDKPVYVFRGIP